MPKTTPTKAPRLRPISFIEVGRLYRKRLPSTELPYYDTYLSHVGRNDVVKATQVADERANPQLWVGSSWDCYKNVRLAYSLVEKVTQKGDQSAEKKAWDKFLKMEKRCMYTNRKIRYLRLRPDRLRKVSRGLLTLERLSRLREIISQVFGDLSSNYREITSALGYGKGMTLSSADPNQVSLPFKLTDPVTVTAQAVPVWNDFLTGGYLALPGYVDWVRSSDGIFRAKARVKVLPGCRITFVDKTSVIKRTIAIEPSANVGMQLAIHRYLRRRLKLKAGIDIQDQSRNRSLALEGSITGELATIDLSSASDLICRELVRWLLPSDWHDLLDSLRSKVGTYRGNEVTFEKFSSMGNGYTFALETVLFYAISKLSCEIEGYTLKPCVYGDDIILPTPVYSTATRLLQFLGSLVNSKKSYFEGPFRESCGLDAFKGVDVRPIFLKNKQLSFSELVATHNHFFRRGDYDICEYLASLLPDSHQVYGPPGPDAGFLFTEDHRKLSSHRRWCRDTLSWIYTSYQEVGIRRKFPQRFLLEASLCDGGCYSSGAPLRFLTKLVKHAVHRDY